MTKRMAKITMALLQCTQSSSNNWSCNIRWDI